MVGHLSTQQVRTSHMQFYTLSVNPLPSPPLPSPPLPSPPLPALHGKLEAVRILLDRCSYNADSADSCGVTPLMDSVRGDHMDMAEFLLHQFKVSFFIYYR